MEGAQLTLSASMGLSFFLAVGVVYAVQGVKWVMEILPTTKTNNLPSWLWVASALIISAIVCYFMKVDALAALGIDVGIYPPWSYFATAFFIAVSSNVIAAVTKPLRKKLRQDGKIICLPPGQEPTTTVTETSDEGTTTTTTTDVAPSQSGNDVDERNDTPLSPVEEPQQSPETVTPAASTGGSVPAYLLNFCDTDPAVGPHVVLLDGKLYRVEHGKVEYLPNGWRAS